MYFQFLFWSGIDAESLKVCYFSEGLGLSARFGKALCETILKPCNTVTNGRMSHILTAVKKEIVRLFLKLSLCAPWALNFPSD